MDLIDSENYMPLALRTESAPWPELPPKIVSALRAIVPECVRLGAALDKMKKIIAYRSTAHDPAEAARTVLDDYQFKAEFDAVKLTPEQYCLLHCAMGKITEAAELAETVYGHLFEGKPLDRTNIVEEIGDSQWYDAVGLNAVGGTFNAAFTANIRKLEARYPDKFSNDRAENRDLARERQVLETHVVSQPENPPLTAEEPHKPYPFDTTSHMPSQILGSSKEV